MAASHWKTEKNAKCTSRGGKLVLPKLSPGRLPRRRSLPGNAGQPDQGQPEAAAGAAELVAGQPLPAAAAGAAAAGTAGPAEVVAGAEAAGQAGLG